MQTVPLDVSLKTGAAFGAVLDPVRLRGELDLILQDLALPAEVRIETRDSTDLKSNDFAIFFDGYPCPHCRRRDDPDPQDTPVREVVREVQANLDSLVTRSIADALWRAWSGAQGPAPDQFTNLLRRLARYRVRTDRVAKYVRLWNETDPEAIFEEALSDAGRHIEIKLHPVTCAELAPQLADSGGLIPMMIDGLFYELGIHAGACIPKGSQSVARNEVRFRINDVRTSAEVVIGSDECLVNDTVDRLKLLNIEGRKALNPTNGNECAIIPFASKDICEQCGLTTWTKAGYLILVMAVAIRRAAPMLISSDIAEFCLNGLEDAFPILVKLVSERVGITRVARVLRTLLEEEISIRDLPRILDRLLTIPPHTATELSKFIIFPSTWGCIRPHLSLNVEERDRTIIELAECVRMAQKAYISHKYTQGQNNLIVYLLDPEIEERLADSRPLTEGESQSLLDAVSAEVGSLPPTAAKPVMLTTDSVRYRLRQELRGAFPDLAVLSYQELSPDTNIQPIARVSLRDFLS